MCSTLICFNPKLSNHVLFCFIFDTTKNHTKKGYEGISTFWCSCQQFLKKKNVFWNLFYNDYFRILSILRFVSIVLGWILIKINLRQKYFQLKLATKFWSQTLIMESRSFWRHIRSFLLLYFSKSNLSYHAHVYIMPWGWYRYPLA